jgi:hypothetical protein
MTNFYPKGLFIRCLFCFLVAVLQFANYANAQAPTSLTYPTPVVYTANVSNVFLSPNVSGIVDSYSLNGTLPAGLSFNSSTGVISGTPTAAKATTVYTVTATNTVGSTSTNFTMTVYNNYLDNNNQQVRFGGSGVTISNPNGGNGRAAGDITLYRNIATISGQAIDCIITTKAVNGVNSWTAYDQTSASGAGYDSNTPEFFAPQVSFASGGGSITYNFQFIFAGTYNTTTKSGDNVVLQNVTLNTYDIDGNGNAGSNQFNEFGGFNSSELGSSSPTVAATYNQTTGLTRFRSTISTNSSTVTAPATRVRVKYTNLSDFTIVVGGAGTAYFFLDFSVGPQFPSLVTTTPSVDLDTQSLGVVNDESACGTSLFFTKRNQNNVSASGSLSQLDITYPSTMIKNGANERLVIDGSTAGTGTHALNFSSGSTGNVTVGGVQFVFTKSVATVDGEVVNKISFTRSSPTTFSVPEAEALLDAFQYDNNAAAPTFGDRRFVVNVLNPTFKSPDAAFTATVNCVSISGHIYHDANGLLGTTDAGTVNASGPSQFAENFAYAILVDPATNQVVASQGIAAGGAYTFGRVTPGKYIVYVSDQPKTAGTEFTEAIFPAGGYLPTGENLGAQAGNDLLIDGKLTLTVGSVPVTNANFGLQVPPTANDVTAASQANPGGTQRVVVPTLNGNDLEDGTLQGGTGNTVKILSLPTNATLYYDGVVVSLASPVISNYNPALLTIDPENGTLVSVFTYSEIDAAGFESLAATVNMPFTDFAIEGKVYHDIDGTTNNLIDGDLISNPDNSGQLYANLVERATGLVKASAQVTNGAFTFNTSNGLQTNTAFDIVLSTVEGVSGSTTGASSQLPTGWVSTAEGSGAGDGSANGILTVNVASASINSGLDFGIEKLPFAGNGSNPITNPTGDVSTVVAPGTFTNGKVSSDPDGFVTGIRITEFPEGANSITVVPTTYFENVPSDVEALLARVIPTDKDGKPTVEILVDPIAEGATTVDIPFKAIDNAGLESLVAGHAVVNSSALPVKLVAFKVAAEGRIANLSWNTTEEVNSDYFDIQHSSDAVSWKTIGKVESNKESNKLQSYHFPHKNTVSGYNYYRLKMVDQDGSFAISTIQSVDIRGEATFLFPNPVSDKVSVSAANGNVEVVELLDLSGKKIMETRSTSDIKVGAIPAGNYLLRIKYADQSSEIKKFVIKR